MQNKVLSDENLSIEDTAWIKVRQQFDPSLEGLLRKRAEQKVLSGEFTREDVRYIEKLELGLIKNSLNVSDATLEKLRTSCSLWFVDLKDHEISSHRKFIGPVIVGLKKILYPILRVLLKDTLRQQRAFNASVISLLADLSNKVEASEACKRSDKTE